ncbi:hypothetical protein T8K17_14845 [Thalassobaculum sp. OXR-137]|uniref:COG3904 family protein n=1 Tax=Thalassobaculum sp. OXR-137 TaxID=3100173 RepID=UPI002AC98439|nr:hypothetical protein [Thalassobaculum sp. OXR-137]WPZ32518.1 hypothetical protein T8K17_14845 [Thalassobaculum sp. OXR-137]
MGRSLRRSAAALALLSALFAEPGHAADFDITETAHGTVLALNGKIESGDSARLERLLSRTVLLEAILESPGGVMVEGLEIGQILRKAKVATRVRRGRECASACFFAFLGGPLRVVEPTGRLGVHMHSAAMSPDYIGKLKRILVSRDLSVDDRIRLIVLLNEQQSAIAAGMIAHYVVRMGVSIEVFDPLFTTHSLTMHWLSAEEMRRFNVVNIVE